MLPALLLCGWLCPAVTPASPLLFWEFLPDPAQVDDASGEWLELHNTSDQAVPLKGWTFSSGSSLALPLDSSLVIPAHGYFTVAKTDSVINGGFKPTQRIGSDWSLPNSNGSLRLFAPGNIPADSVFWSAAWPLRSGHSLERFASTCAGSDASCWGSATTNFGLGDWGTPNVPNSLDTAKVDTEGCVLRLEHVSNQLVGTIVNRGKLNWNNRAVHWEWNRGTREGTITCRAGDTCQVSLPLAGIALGDRLRLRLRIPSDARQADDTSGLWLFQPQGAILLSEIQAASVQNQPEWIELSQGVAAAFDLTGWSLGDSLTRYEFMAGTLLPASGYLVVSSNCAQLRTAWNLPSMPCSQLKSWPRLSQTDDLLVLRDPEGHEQDRLAWNSSFWGSWPDGKSRERRSRALPTQQPDNWMTSPDPLGATPGWGAMIPAGWNAPGQATLEFSLAQKLFAPSDATLPQELSIRLKAPPSWSLTVSVYDMDRHRVRILWQGPPPIDGRVTWDGKTNSGKSSPMGAYLVLLEAQAPDKSRQVRKDWVVLGRRL